MAEAVGLLASGVSIGTLAAQIIGSIVKLKSYWSRIQNVPEDVRDMLEEIENLCYLLADIEVRCSVCKHPIVRHHSGSDMAPYLQSRSSPTMSICEEVRLIQRSR